MSFAGALLRLAQPCSTGLACIRYVTDDRSPFDGWRPGRPGSRPAWVRRSTEMGAGRRAPWHERSARAIARGNFHEPRDHEAAVRGGLAQDGGAERAGAAPARRCGDRSVTGNADQRDDSPVARFQDLVDHATSTVRFFAPFDDFTRLPRPATLDAYLSYLEWSAVRERLAPEQLVIPAECRAVRVRVCSGRRVRSKVERDVDHAALLRCVGEPSMSGILTKTSRLDRAISGGGRRGQEEPVRAERQRAAKPCS